MMPTAADLIDAALALTATGGVGLAAWAAASIAGRRPPLPRAANDDRPMRPMAFDWRPVADPEATTRAIRG
ncbi:hypothetical protein [Sphingomonas sp.]|uniref:hypothetical protein n=1 Tax=Sphingomonas sp. TaxID=28214 RepID=UPI002DD66690|nr:hypothetical protein [Sphingomonas sp.]